MTAAEFFSLQAFMDSITMRETNNLPRPMRTQQILQHNTVDRRLHLPLFPGRILRRLRRP